MKTLGTLLRLQPLAERQRVARAWGIAPPISDELEETLRMERAMREPIAARSFWDLLDADERAVLGAMLGPSARNWSLRELLPERANCDAARAEAALARLKTHIVVDEELARVQGTELFGQRTAFYGYVSTRPQDAVISEKPVCYVPTELATTLYTVGRELNPLFPDRTTLTLDDLLMPYRQGDLDLIGRRYGLSLQVYCSRSDARLAIAENVAQAEAVQYALAHIDPQLRAAYEWLLARGGRATIAELRQFLHQDLIETLRAVHTYEEYAIAFDAFSDGQRVLFIPSRTFDNLRRASVRPRQETGLIERPAPPHIRPAESAILWDIAILVAAIVQGDIELTRSGILPKRTAQRILPLLTREPWDDDDEQQVRYLHQIQYEAIELGIIRQVESEGHVRLELGSALEAWANQDSRMQTHRLIRRWPQSRTWQDLFGKDFTDWYASYLNTSKAREMILKALQACQPGIWYDTHSLLRTLQDNDPFILRPSQRFNGQSGFKIADEIRAHWDHTDGEILIGMLSSTLFDLGLVALGYDAQMPPTRSQANPTAIMLTELGAEVLRGDLGLAQVATARPLVIQPNFEILLLEPHMPALYRLLRFTQLVQLGRASRFRLTREHLLRALSKGMVLQDLINFLQDHSQREIAQNVLYTLADWSRQYKDVRIATVVLVEVESEEIATELCTSHKLRELGFRRVGPLTVSAPEGIASRTVRRTLERAGYAVHVTHHDEAATNDPSIVLGRIQI